MPFTFVPGLPRVSHSSFPFPMVTQVDCAFPLTFTIMWCCGVNSDSWNVCRPGPSNLLCNPSSSLLLPSSGHMQSIQWLRWHLRWHLAYCCDCYCCDCLLLWHGYNHNGFHLLKSSIFSKISYLYSEIAQEFISSPDSVLIDETLWFDETRLRFEMNIPRPGFYVSLISLFASCLAEFSVKNLEN